MDDVLDDDEPDAPDAGAGAVVEPDVDEPEVDELEVESDDVVDPVSFFVSPDPAAAGVEADFADARESVL
ncbi:hypothetical protein GCM10009868_25700 [Terrabacter aerolatus]|uniref:Uncharacterized protein n=1 Tax=Terrabacter aerolatus TaxID=422442 RepID=A0A512D6K9_9MICO|nr:hypothetical protein TAE01_39280 [Terrabacter aerolatus]